MELANVFCIEKANFELSKDNILGKLDNPREGDFVENLKDRNHGNRMSGVYIIKKNDENNLYISDLSLEIDDYGCVGEGFTLGPKFKPGHWTFGYEKGSNGGYWHHDTEEEPVNKEILSKIKENDLIESKRKSFRFLKQVYDSEKKLEWIYISPLNGGEEKEVIESYCDVNFEWGTLRFRGNKKIVMDKLEIIKKKNYERVYFRPSREFKNVAEIADFEWIENQFEGFDDDFKVIEEVIEEHTKQGKVSDFISNIEGIYKCDLCNKVYKKLGKCIEKHLITHNIKLL